MNIEAKGFKIEVSSEELWTIGFSIKRDIESSLKSHWINHQNAWETNEKKKLEIAKTVFNHLGRNDVYDNIFDTAKEVFKAFNDKQ